MNGSFRPSASIPTACVVEECVQRQDELYFLKLDRAPGWAVSADPIPVGTSITVKDGRVV
jgi:hypothetical protein